MPVEERMERQRLHGKGSMPPVVYDVLHRKRSVFAPNHRIKMNVVPMFLGVFIPWTIFVICAGVAGFSLMYFRPTLAWLVLAVICIMWAGLVGVAVWSRKHEADPMWYSFLALMCLIAIFAGIAVGQYNFNKYVHPFREIKDLKVIKGFDAGANSGQNVMDGGIFHFANGNQLEATKSWHFKHRTLYCVIPITSGGATPQTQSYDFWAVGKDCCSLSASDFRCGSPSASSALRVLRDEDLTNYRLAVEQAETLYNIRAAHPIFFEWHEDPQAVVDGWSQAAMRNFLKASAFFGVVCLFAVAMATCSFAWIGRTRSVYGMDFYDEENFRAGGVREKVDMRTQRYY